MHARIEMQDTATFTATIAAEDIAIDPNIQVRLLIVAKRTSAM